MNSLIEKKDGSLAAGLSWLVGLAFDGASAHPLYDEATMQKIVAVLPPDPVAGLAELVRLVSTRQTDPSDFRRHVQILMALDVAAHAHWDRICKDCLAPSGTSTQGRELGEVALRLALEIATEFIDGYGLCLLNKAVQSGWGRKNLGAIMLRQALWLGRKLALVGMLRHPDSASLWEQAHVLCLQAFEQDLLDAAQQALPGDTQATSIKQEYMRLFLMEIAHLDTMTGREIELAFRIAGRVAAAAQLAPAPLPAAQFAVLPVGASRPVLVRRLATTGHALYLDSSGCLPHLQALIARDPEQSRSAEADPLFNRQFMLRESSDMAHRLIEHWGPNPPRRRAQRVALKVPVRLRYGFDSVIEAMAPLEQGASIRAEAAKVLQQQAEKLADAAKAVRETEGRLADASAAGLGVLVSRKYASWARLETLIAVYLEPGPDWIIGSIRRISAEGEMLRLGIRILARRPRLCWFHLRSSARGAVKSHEQRAKESFLEFYLRGILLDFDLDLVTKGEIIVPHSLLKLGLRLEIPREDKVDHASPIELRDASRGFDRVAFEVRDATPYPNKPAKPAGEDEPDHWRWASG